MLLLHAFFALLYFYNVSSYSAIQPQVCNKLSVVCVHLSSSSSSCLLYHPCNDNPVDVSCLRAVLSVQMDIASLRSTLVAVDFL